MKSNHEDAGTDESQSIYFGQQLRALRISLNVHQRELARRAGVSATYIAQIEKGRTPAPPRETAEKILEALQPKEAELRALLRMAAAERGSNDSDEQLPPEVRGLINDLRRYANQLPERFTRGLRTAVREAVK